jgi:hypothetical protein
VNPARGILPDAKPPRGLPVFARNGEILPPRSVSHATGRSR